ncbi:hypothetical protein BG015_009552 [Linnemannia schmuckeri]|uniref:F-box domain-containing protein n=1 Tax=Linnemannia schmuckeri TaxID=64567 RepID=A0A9P5RVR9_9FUNG|nr:hypothetical protein BG015_009552 [Linnemannia schmuckeri]
MESPLPLECLRIVLANLAHNNDAQSLATLLRVNRFFAEATLPFLYADPFQDNFHSFNGRPPKRGRRVHLARILLRQAPPEKVTGLLKAFYFAKQDFDTEDNDNASSLLESESEPYVPALHYLPHIKTLLPMTFPTRDLRSRDSHYYTSDRLTSFLHTSGLEEQYRSFALRGNHYTAHHTYLFGEALRRDVERHLTWALCVPETIQNLTISVTDCKRYLEHIAQFKVLANIQFSFDIQLQVDGFSSQEVIPEQVVDRHARQKEREEHVESIVAFVQEHTRIHNKVLRTVNCLDSYLWRYSDQQESDDCQLRLLKFLPPLHNPTALNGKNMQQFCMNPDDTTLDFVERITTNGATIGLKDILTTLSRSLCRCRALKFISIDLHEDDLFLWAAKEKREFDRQLSNGQVPTRPLVPVQSARLQFGKTGVGTQIDSFVQGFSATLNSLDVRGQYLVNNYDDSIDEPVVCGLQWSLPRLGRLTLMTFNAPLMLDPNALSKCPLLEALWLEDCATDLQVTNAIPSWPLAVLPHLKSLTLKGIPARVFHPDTFHITSELETLCISMDHIGGHHLIPPVQELQHMIAQGMDESNETGNATGIPRRPMWTWDWHLPQLKDLVMTAEFAFCFQFKMLRQTPLLEKFYLNSSTMAGLHERTITLDELRNEESGGGEFISLPELVEFRLVGRWQVRGQVWKTIFGQIAPNIETLEETECSGFDLKEWVEATLTLKNLEMSHSSLAVGDDELLAQGLTPAQYEYDPFNDTVKPGAQCYFQGCAYQFVSPPVDQVVSQQGILLRANRFFAKATLPFLYADPCCERFSTFQGCTERRTLLLARTLLRQVPTDDCTPLLRTFYFGNQDFDCNSDSLPAENPEPYTPFERNWVERMSPEAKARELQFREERRVHLETMVKFAWEHTRICKGVLRHATCEKGYHLQETCLLCQVSPEEYQLALLDCLPQLYNPKVLDKDNLRQFVFNFQEINLEFVEFENVSADEQTMDFFLETKEPFLNQCRSLRKVDMIAFGDEDLFEWAVQGRREYDRPMIRAEVPEKPLVLVEHVKVQFDQDDYGPQIGPIAQEFVNSLESLNALMGCPNVQEVTLFDWMTDYTMTGLQPWKPACLPDLTSLKMNGTSTRTFHPDILHREPKLEDLHIGVGTNTTIDDIPEICDILHLIPETDSGGGGEQFRMLRETPNLETFSLDMQKTIYMDVQELERHEFT